MPALQICYDNHYFILIEGDVTMWDQWTMHSVTQQALMRFIVFRQYLCWGRNRKKWNRSKMLISGEFLLGILYVLDTNYSSNLFIETR